MSDKSPYANDLTPSVPGKGRWWLVGLLILAFPAIAALALFGAAPVPFGDPFALNIRRFLTSREYRQRMTTEWRAKGRSPVSVVLFDFLLSWLFLLVMAAICAYGYYAVGYFVFHRQLPPLVRGAV
jgi:hypothetical protein